MTDTLDPTLDPAGLLHSLSLAISDDEAPSSADLEEADRLLRQPGGIAFAYSLVDQAIAAAEAVGATAPERFADSPLANLLSQVCEEEWTWEEEGEDATPSSVGDSPAPASVAPASVAPASVQPASVAPASAQPASAQPALPAANDDAETGGGAKIIRLFGPATALLAAAAAVLFFVRAPAETDGPGVKAGLTAAPVVASVVARDGPLSAQNTMTGLETTRKNLDGCGVTAPAVVDVGFTIQGDGVVDPSEADAIRTTVVEGAVSPEQTRCLKRAVTKAAFGFERAPTLVMMRLEFRKAPPRR